MLWFGFFIAIVRPTRSVGALRAGRNGIARAGFPVAWLACCSISASACCRMRPSLAFALRRALADARAARDPTPRRSNCLFVVVPVSPDGHALRDVVGRVERAGAVLRAGAAAAGRAAAASSGHASVAAVNARWHSRPWSSRRGATAAVVVVDRGRLAFNVRDTPALWLEWLSRSADLPHALPWWTRGGDLAFFADIAIWIAALIGAALVVRAARARLPAADARPRSRMAGCWLSPSCRGDGCVGGSRRGRSKRGGRAAATCCGRSPRTPRAVGLDLEPRANGSLSATCRGRFGSSSRGRSRTDARPAATTARSSTCLGVPAGEYRITPVADEPARLADDRHRPRSIRAATDAAGLAAAQPIALRFPVTVRDIVVRGDEDARQTRPRAGASSRCR